MHTTIRPSGGALLRRGAVVIPVAALLSAAVLSASIAVLSIISEGRAIGDAAGRAYFAAVTLGPILFAGLLVVGAVAAGLATVVALGAARIQRGVWAGVFAATVTAVTVALGMTLIVSAPWSLVAIALLAAVNVGVAWVVFAIADRRSREKA